MFESGDFVLNNRIFLARDCDTPLNDVGLLRGRLDPPLTRHGEAQAQALAAVLRETQLRLIVAGPLRRAVETARAVALHVDLAVEIDNRFNDRDYGSSAGKPLAEVEERWGSIDAAPEVESPSEVLERTLSAFKDFADRLGDQVGLIVSHDAIIRPLLVALDPAMRGRSLAQETGCYNVLRRGDEGWTVVSINNVPPLRATDP